MRDHFPMRLLGDRFLDAIRRPGRKRDALRRIHVEVLLRRKPGEMRTPETDREKERRACLRLLLQQFDRAPRRPTVKEIILGHIHDAVRTFLAGDIIVPAFL